MEGLSFNQDQGQIHRADNYDRQGLRGRWVADLSSYMRSKQPNNCSNSMESALINLAASIKKLVEEDDSLPLSCKWSPIESTSLVFSQQSPENCLAQ